MPLILPAGTRLVAATHNAGKAREIAALLDGRFEVLSAAEAGVPEPDETESTFTGNALLKARHAAQRSGLPALADDSGLSVTALDGAPGIFSARWAGPDRDFALAMRKVETRLEEIGATDFSAWFTSALAVAWPDGPAVVVQGEVHGHVSFPPRGDRGFGYDPIFVPTGHSQTFGEMDPAAKDSMSHRARAFEQLKGALFD
ncbi:MAG: RdgB/HAM1 family non-canonical purine NTP pyrophosphatase [Brevundimonas sp.]|jgi:XTP/dITP diphosphohydrolase|uniref:RdgB/HAM1 family non-canonical purine NTP pyrophosphatase n=1 Tax=Brevundimonas sp. TaxID=1871086 RepID=UPI0022C185BB|nr:RdgB/HAM1 family non-canonical purine NTP pyrophosphatase [Brevundimonas sp.]MCZ8195368.1 RdgB/HAM1 family non-canonical purine NTP pyrophosphatase [Brevundimonas sp.]